MEITIKEIEVAKLNLQPGDVLAVTIKNNDIEFYDLESLSESLKNIFPNNKAFLMVVRTDNEIKFSVMTETEALSCGSQNYCSDCTCGKKEQLASPPVDQSSIDQLSPEDDDEK